MPNVVDVQLDNNRRTDKSNTRPPVPNHFFFFSFLQKTIQKTAENKKERKKKVIYFLGFGVKN